MKLSLLVGTALLAASTLAGAQAPKSDAPKPRRFDCSQAKDPKACEERVAKAREMHAKASKACEASKGKVKIDLHRCVVISPGGKETSFAIDAILREGMLKGLDQIELTRAREAQIAAFQARDRASHPWIYAVPQ